jgi:hypothetical protein
MSPNDVMQLMQKLANENKAAELAAITQAPSSTTGVTEDDKNRYRDMIFNMHASEELAAEKTLTDDYDNAMTACKAALSAASNYSDAGNIAKIVGEEHRAMNADARFQQSLSS